MGLKEIVGNKYPKIKDWSRGTFWGAVCASIIAGLILLVAGFIATRYILHFLKNPSEKYAAVVMSSSGLTDIQISKEFISGVQSIAIDSVLKLANGEKIKIRILNDQADIDELHRLVDNIGQDKNCILAIGHASSSLTAEGLPLYSKYGLPLIMPIATMTAITKLAIGQGFHAVLRMPPTNKQQALVIAKFLAKIKSDSKILIIGDTDNIKYSNPLSRELASALCDKNLSAIGIGMIGVDAGSTIVRSDWLLESPDIVIFAGMTENGLSIARSLRRRAFKGTLILTDGCFTSDFVNFFPSTFEGKAYVIFQAKPVIVGTDVQSALKTYRDYGIDAMELTKRILDACAEISRKDVYKVISEGKVQLQFSGRVGKYEFSEDGDNSAGDFHVYEINMNKGIAHSKFCPCENGN